MDLIIATLKLLGYVERKIHISSRRRYFYKDNIVIELSSEFSPNYVIFIYDHVTGKYKNNNIQNVHELLEFIQDYDTPTIYKHS